MSVRNTQLARFIGVRTNAASIAEARLVFLKQSLASMVCQATLDDGM